mmetsp:Transcript_94368/g.177632  ORF Transcript_94368/g.177632 Transcript_94368/m.177632 type:complete len:270 (-) Transcript_94368:144-953(-)
MEIQPSILEGDEASPPESPDVSDTSSYILEGDEAAPPESQDVSSYKHSPRSRLLCRLGLPGTKEQVSSSNPQSSRCARKKHCTCIIFDWDDTLFCTSHMHSRRINPPDHLELQKLDSEASRILEHAISLGTTKIVTNAVGGWVEQTSKEHLPKVNALLHKIEVVSARDKFEHKYPNDPVTWKVEAFCAIKENSGIIANLTAIGDSRAEMIAIQEMAKLYHISFFKAVKMQESPTCLELRKELQLLNKKIEQIVNGARNFRISLQSAKPP